MKHTKETSRRNVSDIVRENTNNESYQECRFFVILSRRNRIISNI